jgi:GNAT superfamily N-acetyltransferase
MIENIKNLGALMHEETVFRKLSYNPEKLYQFALDLNNDPNSLVVVTEKTALLAQVYPHIYTDDLIAVDQLIYVHPQHRLKGLARGLVNLYVSWAESMGAKMIMLGSSTGFDGAEQFFNSCGFKKIGGNYLR